MCLPVMSFKSLAAFEQLVTIGTLPPLGGIALRFDMALHVFGPLERRPAPRAGAGCFLAAYSARRWRLQALGDARDWRNVGLRASSYARSVYSSRILAVIARTHHGNKRCRTMLVSESLDSLRAQVQRGDGRHCRGHQSVFPERCWWLCMSGTS